jgi:hypothetical protein
MFLLRSSELVSETQRGCMRLHVMRVDGLIELEIAVCSREIAAQRLSRISGSNFKLLLALRTGSAGSSLKTFGRCMLWKGWGVWLLQRKAGAAVAWRLLWSRYGVHTVVGCLCLLACSFWAGRDTTSTMRTVAMITHQAWVTYVLQDSKHGCRTCLPMRRTSSSLACACTGLHMLLPCALLLAVAAAAKGSARVGLLRVSH